MRRLLSPAFTLPTFLFLCLLGVALALLGPRERSLGAAVRLVYLHGAWVWTALLAFGAAALTGALGLLLALAPLRRQPVLSSPPSDHYPPITAHRSPITDHRSLVTDHWLRWSRALGRAGLIFWLAYIPLSMLAAQANWNGLFWAEPRWRVAFEFAAVGLLLQMAAHLLEAPFWTGALNTVYFVALILSLQSVGRVMHPASPIRESGSLLFQGYFTLLVGVCLLAGLQLARWWRAR